MICLTTVCSSLTRDRSSSYVRSVHVQEEVLKLQTEVAELDSKLIAVTLALTEATTARVDERYPLIAQL